MTLLLIVALYIIVTSFQNSSVDTSILLTKTDKPSDFENKRVQTSPPVANRNQASLRSETDDAITLAKVKTKEARDEESGAVELEPKIIQEDILDIPQGNSELAQSEHNYVHRDSLFDNLQLDTFSEVMSEYIKDNKNKFNEMKSECVKEVSSNNCILTPSDMSEEENQEWVKETESRIRQLILEYIKDLNVRLDGLKCDFNICEVLISFDFQQGGAIQPCETHQAFSRIAFILYQSPHLDVMQNDIGVRPMGHPSSGSKDVYYQYFVLVIK